MASKMEPLFFSILGLKKAEPKEVPVADTRLSATDRAVGSRANLNRFTVKSLLIFSFHRHHPDRANVIQFIEFSRSGILRNWSNKRQCLQKQKGNLTPPWETRTFEHSPPRWFPAPSLARKGNGYKTYHFAPFSSSSCRAPLSSPASTYPDGNRWGGPRAPAPAAARTRSDTTPPSRTSGRFADAEGVGVQGSPGWFPNKSRSNN